jgi:hypothetical protein
VSFEDPFDSAPLDDAAPAEEAKQPEVKAKVTKAKPAVQAESDGKVVLTFKGGRDFDAPWVVIHANGLQEAHDFVVGDKRISARCGDGPCASCLEALRRQAGRCAAAVR